MFIAQVIGSVDFVDFTGVGMSNHGGGAVDAPWYVTFSAHYSLGIVFGAKVRMA